MRRILIIIFLVLLVSSVSARNKWLGKDKVLHFTGSAFLTYWNYGLSEDILGQSSKKSTYFAASFTLALGTAKEYSDKKLKSTGFSWHDLAYDTAGIVAGLVLINNLR
ncbi:MAG: hypothetical protein HOB92_01935 [Candidatus Cloacimonetes bacterium]|nr:hypothetical protein [Candidatus Cloacimonadota bacterium]